MADSQSTRPSDTTRAEEARDAQVRSGVGETAASDPTPNDDAQVDAEVAEHYEEMIERGATQEGEGRLP